MSKTSNKIVFFGSGLVASKSLELLNDSFDIECAITKSSTKELMQAVVPKTTVLCVNNKIELDEVIKKSGFESKIAVLIDFGILISQQSIDSFPLGIINSHFSLLPQWRGADPITFSILSGQEKTGVSLMLLSAGMDEGLVIAQAECKITTEMNNALLTQELIDLSDALLKDCIPLYINGGIEPIDQTSSAELMGISSFPTYSRKLTKEDGLIDWHKPAEVIEREIRAYSEWPRSYTKINGIDVIIRSAKVVNQPGPAGKYSFDKKGLVIYCGQDALDVKTIQPAGKKEMPISAFLNGNKI